MDLRSRPRVVRLLQSVVVFATVGGSVLPCRTAGAQLVPASDTVQLSLRDALRRGGERNEAIGIARSQVRGAAADRASLRALFRPQLTSTTALQRTLQSPYSGLRTLGQMEGADPRLVGAVEDFLGRRNSYSGGVSATQMLFNRQASAGIRAASETHAVLGLQLAERELDVSLDIVQAYYGAVLAERVADISTAALDQANVQLAHIRRTHASGNASEMDVLNVEVQRDNLEPQRIQALNARDQAMATLKRLIDLRPDVPLSLSDALDPGAFRAVPSHALDSIAAGALQRRPQLTAAERSIRVRQFEEQAARASGLPSISLASSYAKQGAWASGSPNGNDLRDNWTLSIVIQTPFVDGGQRRADAGAARERGQQAQLQLSQLRKGISLDVTLQRAELDRASAAVTARSHTVELAARTYELMALAYRKGLVNTLQLSDARLQLRQSRVNEVQALHDYFVALARLRRTAGLSPEPLAGVERPS